MRGLAIFSILAAAGAAVYGLEEDLPDAAAAKPVPKDYKLPEKVRHMDGPPPGVDLSSLSVKPNVIAPQRDYTTGSPTRTTTHSAATRTLAVSSCCR